MSVPARLEIPDEVLEIARTLEAAGHEVWCVGGALRDHLLGDLHSDIDFATSARPEDVRKLFRRTAAVGIKYGTVGVLDRNRVLHEVTTFRRDVSTDGRHAVVEYGVSLEEDLARRDFTINAIAYHPLRGEWRDPFGGAEDLERRVVRAVGDPAERFREDYLRILRAVRFAARFGFGIDPATWEAARAAAPGLERLSAERVRDEWLKGLATAQDPGELVRLWIEVGAAGVWLPELLGFTGPVDRVAARAGPRDTVRLTALYASDPVAALSRLKASNAESARVSAIVAGPPAPAGDSEAAVRRWVATVGSAADDLLAMHLLRHGAEAPWTSTVRATRDRGDPVSRGQLAIDGRDVQALGASGPRVGDVLSQLLDRVLTDPSLNTRETLIALAREIV